MSLFDTSKIAIGNKNNSVAEALQMGDIFLSSTHGQSMLQLFGQLQLNKCLHFQTNSSFSTHNLLEYCLRQTGPSKVFLTTYSISEDPARVLLSLKQEGLITELNAIFSDRMKTNNAKAFQLVQRFTDNYKLLPCHAKTFVLVGGLFPVSVITSANMNKNKRIEAGVLDTSLAAANFHSGWIKKYIQDGI